MSEPTNATVVAVNHSLGIFVIEAKKDDCAILETNGRIALNVGDIVNADWSAPDFINVTNATQNCDMRARVQRSDVTRGEAISSMAVI